MRLLVINTVLDPSTATLRTRHPGKVFQRPVIAGQALPPRGRRVLPVDLLSKAVVDELERLVQIGNVKVMELGGRTPVNFMELRIRLGHIKCEMTTLDEAPAPAAESPEAPQVEVAPEPASSADRMRGQPAHTIMLDDWMPLLSGSPVVLEEHADEGAVALVVAAEEVKNLAEQIRKEGLPARHEGMLGRWVENDEGHTFIPELTAPPEGAQPVIPCSDEHAPTQEAVPESIEKYLDPVKEVPAEAPSVETFTPPPDIDGLIRNSKNKALMTVLAMFDKSGTGKNKLRLVAEVAECFMGDPDPVVAHRALTFLRDQG